MRHDQIANGESYAKVDVSALWPTGAAVSPLPVVDLDERACPTMFPTPSAPDIPAAVGGLIAGSYAALIGAFALATAGSAESLFVIVVAALFVTVYFAIPRLFLRIEPKQGRRPSLSRFMHAGMDTLTGRCSGGAALVQMMIVPVSLTAAVLAMGVAVSVYL